MLFSDISVEPIYCRKYLFWLTPPCCSNYSNKLPTFLVIKSILFIVVFAVALLVKSKTAYSKFNSANCKVWFSLPAHRFFSCVSFRKKNVYLVVESNSYISAIFDSAFPSHKCNTKSPQSWITGDGLITGVVWWNCLNP